LPQVNRNNRLVCLRSSVAESNSLHLVIYADDMALAGMGARRRPSRYDEEWAAHKKGRGKDSAARMGITLLYNNVAPGTVIEPRRVVYCESVTELGVIGRTPPKCKRFRRRFYYLLG
jgi:hypothetical protein